jgi:hypothetical protein
VERINFPQPLKGKFQNWIGEKEREEKSCQVTPGVTGLFLATVPPYLKN